MLLDDIIDNINLDVYDNLLFLEAVSIVLLLLVKVGLLDDKTFMADINKEEIFEGDFQKKALVQMVGWDDVLPAPIEDGYIMVDNIITSVSYNYVKWAFAFGKMLGIDILPKTFGL